MNGFQNSFLLCSLIMGSVCGQEILEDVRTPGFRVTFDEQGWIRVWYRGIPVVSGANFSVAKPNWQGSVFPGRSQKWHTSTQRDGDTWVMEVKGSVPDGVSCTTTVTTGPSELEVVHDYHVTGSADVGFVYSDCFFDLDFLDGAAFKDQAGGTGVLRRDGVGTLSTSVKTLDFSLAYGILRVEVEQDQSVGGQKKSGGWELRNVSDRKWGAERRKTFSIPNVFERSDPQDIQGRTVYRVNISPNDALDAEIARRRDKLRADRDAKMASLAAEEVAREKRRQEVGGAVLYPAPQEVQRLAGAFPLSAATVVTLGAEASSEEKRILGRLQEEWRDYLRVTVLSGSRASGQQTSSGQILLGIAGSSPKLEAEFDAVEQAKEKTHTPHPEGYRLEVTPDRILLLGDDVRGLWFGVQALMQLPQLCDGAWRIPCLSIRDWPDFEVRAMMLTLGHSKQIDFLKQTIRRVLPRMRVNMMFLGGASIGKIAWASHPEVGRDGAFSPAQVRELADLARENFIEPVPHIQGFGHTGPLKQSHPELLAPLDSGRTPCFDITKPEVREFIFDLYQDAVDTFRPEKYFHVGFDEAMGLQTVAGDRDPAEVIAAHITAVNSWLNERGLRMIMWADMLLDKEEFGASSAANSRNPHYGNVYTAPAIDMIPKNVMLANWYYGGAEEHPQLGVLKGKGFDVFPTTWYKPENNYRFLKNSHAEGLRWASGSSWMYCSATNPTMMGALLGEYAWTAGRPALDELSYDQLGLLSDLLKPPRISDGLCVQSPIDLAESANRSCVDVVCGDDEGWLDLGPMKDLSALVPGSRLAGRYQFRIAGDGDSARCVLVKGPKTVLQGVPTQASVAVGRCAGGLVILHASNLRSIQGRPVGQYDVVFEDGSSETISLKNTIAISPWVKPDRYGSWRQERQKGYCLDTTLAWTGYTLGGDTVELTAFEWRNPQPEKAIAEIRITVLDHSKDAALALCGLTVLERK